MIFVTLALLKFLHLFYWYKYFVQKCLECEEFFESVSGLHQQIFPS